MRRDGLNLRDELGEPAPDQDRHATAAHGYEVRGVESSVPRRAHGAELAQRDLTAAQRRPPAQRPFPKVDPVADAPQPPVRNPAQARNHRHEEQEYTPPPSRHG